MKKSVINLCGYRFVPGLYKSLARIRHLNLINKPQEIVAKSNVHNLISDSLLSVFFTIALLCSSSLSAAPVINSFVSTISVEKDSSLLVTEQINITTDGQNIQHGIYRDVPTRYQTQNGEVNIQFNVINTGLNNSKTPYFTRYESNGIRVYMGDKYKDLSVGTYTFSLTYRVRGELGYFKDHDELYWNVTGNGWDYPIRHAKAIVRLPQGAFHTITGTTAYTGYQGSRGDAFESQQDAREQTIIFATNQPLNPHQGLTIVLGWQKGFVTPISLFQIKNNRMLLILFIGCILLLIYYYWAWRRYGVDGPRKIVIPEYDPPAGFTPATLRYILNLQYDKTVLSCSILNLAVKGYLKIQESKHFFSTHYALVKEPEFNARLSSEEQVLANALFNGSDLVELHQLERLNKMETKFIKNLEDNYKKNYFVTNTGYTLVGMLMSLFLFITAAAYNPNAFPTVIVLIFLFSTSPLLYRLKKDILTQKIRYIFWFVFIFSLTTGFSCSFLISGLGVQVGVYGVLFIFIALVNVIFANLLKRPTPLGQELNTHTKGFKLFLNATEKDRLNFRNPPELTPQIFERYLPYALALGVEQHWAEQFTSILEQANYQPNWYVGPNLKGFNSVSLASTISNSFSGAISSATTAPGSSSGFGSSGSSGGGGGGGVGGGW
jgi:uncharacterized membrane protein